MTDNVSEIYLRKPGPFDIRKKWEMQRAVFEAGTIAALYDALILARDSGLPPPEWAVEGAIKVIEDRLKHGFATGGKGQSGNELRKYRNAMKKFRRWQVVDRLRKEKGATKAAALALATDQLKGTPYEAKHDTIADCYAEVQKNLKNPETAKQYYPAMYDASWLTDTGPAEVKG